MLNNLSSIWSGRAALGETAMWHPLEKKLYWIDITKGHINRLNVDTGQNQYFQVSGVLGTVVARPQGGVLATLANKVIAFDFASEKITTLSTVFPENRTDLRMNDGKCDTHGRFWIGVASEKKNGRGGLYRYDNTNSDPILMEEDVIFSNGMSWSPDYKKFYYVDTAKYCVYHYDFDLEKGLISNRSILFKLEGRGKPDGLAVDRKGYIWLAVYNGGKIIRLSPQGVVDRVIELPVDRPTSMVFGGSEANSLFITSCSRDVHENRTLAAPAGDIFSIQVDIGGFPEPMFIG